MRKSVFATIGMISFCLIQFVEPAFASPAANVSAAQVAPKLIPHRAVYDMKLAGSDEQSGIAGVNGRMVYDFTGNACDGYSVRFRFVTEFRDVSGGAQITDLQTSSFEEPKAQSYQFLSKTFVDQKLVEETRGTAHAGKKAKTIDLKEPEDKSLEIGAEVLFPTQHLRTILDAANSGIRFVAADIYDGAESGEKVYATTSVIGAKGTLITSSEKRKAELPLRGKAYFPVTIAYFDPSADSASGEQMPVYQLSFRLFQNGVSSDLKIDYGNFSIQGEMASLEIYDETSCDKE